MPKKTLKRRSSKNSPATVSYQTLEPKRLLAVAIANTVTDVAESASQAEVVQTVDQFRQAYRSTSGSNDFNAALDYDGNGTVNSVDLLKFRQHYQHSPVPLAGSEFEPVSETAATSFQSAEPIVANSLVVTNPTIDLSLFDAEGPDPLQADGSLAFDALDAQYVSPNGNGWRHELKIDTDLRVAMTETFEDFSADITFDLAAGSKLIAVQYHAGGLGTLVKLYVDDHSLNTSNGYLDGTANNGIFDVYVRLRRLDGTGEDILPLGTIVSGDTIDFRVVNDHGSVTVAGMGVEGSRTVLDSDRSYLKFGNYLQAQDVDGNNIDNSDDWAQFYADTGIDHGVVTFENTNYVRIVDSISNAVAPVISSMDVGNGTIQRSTVDSVTLTIDGLVTLAPNALNFVQRSDANGATGTTVETTHTANTVNGNTELTISFASSTHNSEGAFDDGYYQLTVDHTKVKRAGSNVAMAQDYVFGADAADKFFSFYGDANGDGSVSAIDLLTFRQTYRRSAGAGGYNAALDYDANGTVNALDLLRFRQRYRRTLEAPTPEPVVVEILNPGFEDSFNDWVEDEPVANSGVTSSGANSAKVGVGGRISQLIEVEPNSTYRLSAMVEDDGRLGVTVGGNTLTSLGSSNNFEEVSVVFSTGSATSALIFGEAPTEQSRFDDFTIAKV